MGDVVLGAGIAGLIYGYLHSATVDKIVGLAPGGAMASSLPVGPRYLHMTPRAHDLLYDLGFEHDAIEARRVAAGFFPPSFASRMIEREAVRTYALKTRGLDDVPEVERAMRRGYDVFIRPSLADIAIRLADRLKDKLVTAEIHSIDLTRGRVNLMYGTQTGYVDPEHAVSTLPVPAILKMLRIDDVPVRDLPMHNYVQYDLSIFHGSYHSIPVRFAYYQTDVWGPWTDETEYVYVYDRRVPYSRIARLRGSDGQRYLCAEFPGEAARLPVVPLVLPWEPDRILNPVRSVYVEHGRLLSRFVDYGSAFLSGFGRFGEWSDWILTHDLLETR